LAHLFPEAKKQSSKKVLTACINNLDLDPKIYIKTTPSTVFFIPGLPGINQF
jgi:hypothetical protein